MIIPVRCFTCGKVLANLWLAYQARVHDLEEAQKQQQIASGAGATIADLPDQKDVMMFFERNAHDTILNELGVDRMCCRRHMLTNVDIIDII